MIITGRPLRIVATILARDEEDVIGRNIEHHVNQGVSRFIVTDNLSKDDTRKIVSGYKEVAEVIDAGEDDHRQSEWVTRMARMACRLEPDWVVHLDADEFWGGFSFLRRVNYPAFGSTAMFLHPPGPSGHYLDFSGVLPGECKIGHRPDPDVVVRHGNHSCNLPTLHTDSVWRHHYPIRSLPQLTRKAVSGHAALSRRGAVCERWKLWNDLHERGELGRFYETLCDRWSSMVKIPNMEDLLAMMEGWSTPEVVAAVRAGGVLPRIGRWSPDGVSEPFPGWTSCCNCRRGREP